MKTKSRHTWPRLIIVPVMMFLAAPSAVLAAAPDNDTCVGCHGDAGKVNKVVELKEFEKSVHSDLDCVDCHETITQAEHEREIPKVSCSSCHEDEEAEFRESVHGIAKVDDGRFQPSCTTCHGAHEILSKRNPLSLIHPKNIETTCGHCHSQPEVMKQVGRRDVDPVAHYQLSVHGIKLKEKLEKNPAAKDLPATCTNCHGSHGIYPRLHPKSTFSKYAIPATCGKCHKEEGEHYLRSVHWQSVKQGGNFEAPVCYDCHGEHEIHKPGVSATGSPLPSKLASSELCANCHANPVLMGRFGLDPNRFSSYMSTYHGLAVLRGSPDAAACVSCHNVHDIYSAKDAKSPVHPDNLAATCGACHTIRDPSFVKVPVHPLNQQERNPLAYFFRMLYVWMIVVVIGGMILHNLLIFSYYVRLKWRAEKNQKKLQRFGMFQVAQHVLLFLSFSTLAITGFALKFPDAGWAQALSWLGLNEPVRAVVHRIAGVVLMSSGALQAVFFVSTRPGRRDIRALVPRYTDLTDFVKNMLFHLRLRGERPQYGRYDYTEKAEYLALIWGTILMALTGLILWFPETFLRFLPVASFEVAEVVHFYEAILAVSAIVVWHLFFTIFHPEKYPLSFTFLDGKVTEREHHHHHPLEKLEEGDDEESTPPAGG